MIGPGPFCGQPVIPPSGRPIEDVERPEDSVRWRRLRSGRWVTIPFGGWHGRVTVEALGGPGDSPADHGRLRGSGHDRVREAVDATTEMQIRVSEVFGPLKDHPPARPQSGWMPTSGWA